MILIELYWIISCEDGQLFTVTARMILLGLFCVKMGSSLRSLPEWSVLSYSVWRLTALLSLPEWSLLSYYVWRLAALLSLPEWFLLSYSVWRWSSLYCHYQNDPHWVILYQDGQLFTVTARMILIELFCIKMGISLLPLPEWSSLSYSVSRWAALCLHNQNDPYWVTLYEDEQL